MGSGGRPRLMPAPLMVQIKLRLYTGRDDDLVAFLEGIEPGLRSAWVKQALRSRIEDESAVSENSEAVFDVTASLLT